jgi:hypothetical protein
LTSKKDNGVDEVWLVSSQDKQNFSSRILTAKIRGLTKSKGICYSEDVLIFFKVFSKWLYFQVKPFLLLGQALAYKNYMLAVNS